MGVDFYPCNYCGEFCPYCTNELATDDKLLVFALEKLGLTRDQLLKMVEDKDKEESPDKES